MAGWDSKSKPLFEMLSLLHPTVWKNMTYAAVAVITHSMHLTKKGRIIEM